MDIFETNEHQFGKLGQWTGMEQKKTNMRDEVAFLRRPPVVCDYLRAARMNQPSAFPARSGQQCVLAEKDVTQSKQDRCGQFTEAGNCT